ncbi:PIN domain-containing protein [Nostoc sp. CHAB 5834]|nr:PIN domain-containing protein [Nostoc sp. CHAB 5834]
MAQRQPFIVASARALNTVMQNQVQGYVSGHAVTNLFYILRRQVGNEVAGELLAKLLQHLQVASVTDEVIRQALNSPIKDFEDAVTSAAALTAGLEIIVTRNTPDFVASLVPAMLPDEFLTMLI